MSRRKRSDTGEETIDAPEAVEDAAVEQPEAKPEPAAPVRRLKLLQNRYVRGVFAPEGTVFEFTEAEAQKRLAKTEGLWAFA